MLLQNCSLDMANYYTADTNPWGMFDAFGVPGRVYYAFVAFNQLTKTPNRVACEPRGTPRPEITMCAGLSDDHTTASILISNYASTESPLAVSLQNLPLSGRVQAETLAVDATHEFTRIGAAVLEPGKPRLTLSLPGNAVYLVRLHSLQK